MVKLCGCNHAMPVIHTPYGEIRISVRKATLFNTLLNHISFMFAWSHFIFIILNVTGKFRIGEKKCNDCTVLNINPMYTTGYNKMRLTNGTLSYLLKKTKNFLEEKSKSMLVLFL